jgi:hypothetical protein
MSIASHLHHLFNADTCQAYIHTLRWKDRPLQCPRCQSHNVGPQGTGRPIEGLWNGHTTALKSTCSPSRLCGSVTAGVPC